jgi:hypothetical protein
MNYNIIPKCLLLHDLQLELKVLDHYNSVLKLIEIDYVYVCAMIGIMMFANLKINY